MKKTKLIVVLLTVIAIVVLAMVILPQREETKKTESEGPKVEIAAAIAEIPAYTEVTAEMLEMKSYPEELVPQGAYMSMDGLLGATTLVDIAPGEIMVSHHVVSKEENDKRLAMKIEPGKRAMTLEVDDFTGVSNLIKVGDRVDVILVAVEAEEETAAQYAGTMLLQNIEVLALDQAMVGAPMAEDGTFYYGSVTLALSPKQAVEAAIAVKVGSVYMTLRGQDDGELLPIEPFEGWELFEIGHMEEALEEAAADAEKKAFEEHEKALTDRDAGADETEGSDESNESDESNGSDESEESEDVSEENEDEEYY